jgi:flagellar basal-body rod protein FlgF
MDRLIYTAMSGAKALEQRQEAMANNLANANSNGFRADLMAFRSVPIRQEGAASTRVFALEATAGFDGTAGPLMQTGRSLDVAIAGQGYFVVQGLDGVEANTRNGAFEVGTDGTLQTKSGLPVVGDGGPLVVPPGAIVSIGSDGTVSAKVGSQAATQVGRLKLTNDPIGELRKSADGLLRRLDGEPSGPGANVTVAQGVLEGSNVNVVQAMVGMISVSRQFEMQMRMLQTAEQNEQRALNLLGNSG